MSYVELVDLSKSYGDTLALARTSLSVREGELFALLGPSGCGKTTTLRIVAGFVRPDSGDVLIAGMSQRCREMSRSKLGSDERGPSARSTAPRSRPFPGALWRCRANGA